MYSKGFFSIQMEEENQDATPSTNHEILTKQFLKFARKHK